MNLLKRLIFNLWYFRRAPWDSGIVPPELVDFIQTHPAGRALDLGCGTGTSTLALAQAGWQVTGVDFAPRAIQTAKRKLALSKVEGTKNANAGVDFLVADVTRLPSSLFSTPYDLVLDIGCFHGLSKGQRAAYLDNLERLLAPGGYWLLYGFFKSGPDASGPRLAASEPDAFAARFPLQWRKDGYDKKKRPSVWLLFQKPY
ncbi:MAG: class I SAM-dependent methyltransferase [Chloroflexi bacterium]|nr:class I SAM-dependent methyltransferase [Chloroflexota bacterium]